MVLNIVKQHLYFEQTLFFLTIDLSENPGKSITVLKKYEAAQLFQHW